MYRLIVKMAWKNLFARASRTLLGVVMIAVSMAMMVSIEGLYDAMASSMIEKNKRSATGDISIFAKGYRINKDLQYTIKDATTIEQEIRKLPGIDAVVVRVSVDGLLATARKSSFGSIVGIDLQAEERFGKFSEFLKKGSVDFHKNGALIGIELAKTLKVGVGSKVVFSTQDHSGEINSMVLYIRGVVQTTNMQLDKSAIFVDIKKLRHFLQIKPSEATQIAIMSKDKTIYALLKSRYKDLEVKSFVELEPMLKQNKELMVMFNSITFFIVMGVVFIGIFGVMYVSILDRIREFGILLGIGMSYGYIRLEIIFESLFVALLGFGSGAMLALGILWYLKIYGLDLSGFSNALEMWGYESVLHAVIKPSYFVNTFVAIVGASLLSVVIPLRKIKKLNPIDVIKVQK